MTADRRRPSSFYIPERFRAPLRLLADLTKADYDAVIGYLGAGEPSLATAELAKRMDDAAPGLAGQSEDLVDALIALTGQRTRRSERPAQLAELVSASRNLKLSDQQRSLLAERLTAVLSSDVITIGAKALDLMTDYANVFASARVITDVRPVFPEEDAEAPTAAVVVHTLRIDYFGTDGEGRTFYVALDSGDLRELRKLIDRGFSKTTSLKALLESTDLTYWQETREETNADG